MGRLMLPGVEQTPDGRVFHRRRFRDASGKRVTQRIRLPALDDPGFASAYAAAHAGAEQPRAAAAAGTIAALAQAFRAELPTRRTKRGKLSEATLRNYREYSSRIEAEHGHRLVRQVKPIHVYAIQSKLSETPGVANITLAVLRLMLGLACRLGWADSNAAAGVPALAIGEHQPWPARVVEAAITAAPPMTRLAIVTLLCSGQRGGDVIRMQHGWHDKRVMQLRQEKTGKYAAVPMHPVWVAEIEAMPRKSVTILYDRQGKPFDRLEVLRDRINLVLRSAPVIAAIDEAVARDELAPGVRLHPHGLRKNAACHFVEQGLSRDETGALCGMTPEMVDHYTKRKQVYLIAQRLADRVVGATVLGLRGPQKKIAEN